MSSQQSSASHPALALRNVLPRVTAKANTLVGCPKPPPWLSHKHSTSTLAGLACSCLAVNSLTRQPTREAHTTQLSQRLCKPWEATSLFRHECLPHSSWERPAKR